MKDIDLTYDQIITIPNGPAFIKNVSRNMKSPGYWISKIENPDKILLSSDKIKQTNEKIKKTLYLVNDIEKYPKYIRKKSFQKQLKQIFNLINAGRYIDDSFETITPKTIKKLKKNTDISIAVKRLKVNFAMTVKYSEVRLLPTDTAFLKDKETFDIDRIQVAGIDLGEPLAVISKTKDKKWSYVISSAAEGWIKTQNIAFTSKEVISDWINADNFVVVKNSKSDVFLDEDMKQYYDYLRMSAKLPLIKKINSNKVCVKIPVSNRSGMLYFKKAYIDSSEVSLGFLKYTQRNVIYQAFKHLNSPYAWGGFSGEQDCSTFVRQVFGCFGFILPRTSSSQIKCGNNLMEMSNSDSIYTKNMKITDNALPAISLIYLPGHIMIYIGKDDYGIPYVIHSIWGTEDYNDKKEKIINFINRIVVSNLSIGDNTYKGSLIERITKINTLK